MIRRQVKRMALCLQILLMIIMGVNIHWTVTSVGVRAFILQFLWCMTSEPKSVFSKAFNSSSLLWGQSFMFRKWLLPTCLIPFNFPPCSQVELFLFCSSRGFSVPGTVIQIFFLSETPPSALFPTELPVHPSDLSLHACFHLSPPQSLTPPRASMASILYFWIAPYYTLLHSLLVFPCDSEKGDHMVHFSLPSS